MSETQKDCGVGLIQPQGNKKKTEGCLYIPMVTFSLEVTSEVFSNKTRFSILLQFIIFFSPDGISILIV